MPYIVKSKRDLLDSTIEQLHKLLVDLELDDPQNNFEGAMNYTITKLITMCYTTPSYREVNDVVGLLECVKQEYYRKVAANYENQKEFENGPVYPT